MSKRNRPKKGRQARPRVTTVSSAVFGAIESKSPRSISTGAKVLGAAALLGVAYAGYHAYKSSKKAKAPKIISLSPVGKGVAAVPMRPGGAPTAKVPPTKPMGLTTIIVPKDKINVKPEADPSNQDFGSWKTTEKILTEIGVAADVVEYKSYLGQKFAGVDVFPGDMGIKVRDHEDKNTVEVLFSPFAREGQLTFNNILVGKKKSGLSDFMSTAWSTYDEQTVDIFRKLGYAKAPTSHDPFYHYMTKRLGGAAATKWGDAMKEHVYRSSIYTGDVDLHWARAKADKLNDYKASKYLKRIVEGSIGPRIPDHADSAIMYRHHGVKWPTNLIDRPWALDRMGIAEDRRNVFEQLYSSIATSRDGIPVYPNFIVGQAARFGGPVEGFYHALTSEETWGEWFMEELLPLISTIVDVILTILAAFTAGATLLVMAGLKVLEAAISTVTKVVKAIEKVLSYVQKAIAFVCSGLENIARAGVALLTDNISKIVSKTGTISVEAGPNSNWNKLFNSVGDFFQGGKEKDSMAVAGKQQVVTAFQLERACKGLRKVRSQSGKEKLWTLEKATFFYATPAAE